MFCALYIAHARAKFMAAIGCFSLALVLSAPRGADASSVAIVPALPEIHVGQIEVAYDAALDRLTANGLAQTLDQGANAALTVLGRSVFSLSAAIGDTGALRDGSFRITGKLTEGGPVQTLLAGSVAGLGYALPATGFNGTPGGTFDPLDFVVQPTSGVLKSLFPQESGIRITGSGFPGTWDNPFTNRAEHGGPYGQADVFAPLPGAVWLLGSGLAVILSLGRRRRTA